MLNKLLVAANIWFFATLGVLFLAMAVWFLKQCQGGFP
jgi:hypothetical protein